MHCSHRPVVALVPLLVLVAGQARGQTVVDPNLTVQQWTTGLSRPTGAAFLGASGDMLAIEKDTGRVKLVRNRRVASTVLDLDVANDSERGLLGITTHPDFATNNQVYLYYTASGADGGDASDNRIERYTWDPAAGTLRRNKIIAKFPGTPGPNHDGGKIAFGPGKRLYAQVGDLNRNELTTNFQNSAALTRSAVIVRLKDDGNPVTTNPFYSPAHIGTANEPLNDIYAYGVRNGFGLAFDPVRGDLWDTENGASAFDEINRVRPGFNSGWEDVMGPAGRGGSSDNLVSLGSAAYYSDPRLSWVEPIAPTDLEFMNSGRLGGKYNGDLFVGTVKAGGVLLRFDLSPSRKTLALDGPLADSVADNSSGGLLAEQTAVQFGSGFGTVSDIFPGPGGLYVMSLTNGTLYRITTSTSPASLADANVLTMHEVLAMSAGAPVPEPAMVGGIGALCLAALRRRRPS